MQTSLDMVILLYMTQEAKPGSIEQPLAGRGSGAIFYIRETDQFMFFLRDDKDWIPFPNMIDIIGGHLEGDETAEQGALREIAEELEYTDTGESFRPDTIVPFDRWVDNRKVEQNIFGCVLEKLPNIRTNEGQGLVLLGREQLAVTDFAFGYQDVVLRYAASVG